MREYTKWALQEVIGWEEFENICTDFLYCQNYPNIRQAGRYGDRGRDAVVLFNQKESLVFAFSMEQNPVENNSSKFFREYSKWEKAGIEKFVFVSNQNLGAKKIDLHVKLKNPPVEVYDITDLVRFFDLNEKGEQIKRKYGLTPEITTIATYPSKIQEGRVFPLQNYSLLSFRDFSHGFAKRYSVDVLLNRIMSKTEIMQIVKNVTDLIKNREYYRTEIVKERWAGEQAHIVWSFMYLSMEDVSNSNWICKSQWVSETLSHEFTPLKLKGDSIGNQVMIEWNENYEQMAQFNKAHSINKEEYLAKMKLVFQDTKQLIHRLIEATSKYEEGKLNQDAYMNYMKTNEQFMTNLYHQATEIGLPPIECKDLDTVFQSMMACAHNIVLPFTDQGLKTWADNNRRFLVRQAISSCQQKLEFVEFEFKKIN